MVTEAMWHACIERLKETVPQSAFSQYITPLHAEFRGVGITLWAPNQYVLEGLTQNYLTTITQILTALNNGQSVPVMIGIGEFVPTQPAEPAPQAVAQPIPGQVNHQVAEPLQAATRAPEPQSSTEIPLQEQPQTLEVPVAPAPVPQPAPMAVPAGAVAPSGGVASEAMVSQTPVSPVEVEVAQSVPVVAHQSNLNPTFVFGNFVIGKSNQLAEAAAEQVAKNPGGAYNPLFMYGGVGLGKTHLMHAIGNKILADKPEARVVYLHSERFVADMVKALQSNTINEFKRFYRSVDALLIDDIQFFAGKERSQEEFFHTFNALLEGQQQIILTSDRYPKEISGIEERLQSRFGSGLTVAVEPPELETRVAILMTKAQQLNVDLPNEVAFFIAKRIRSNVRELEGALKRVIANAQFTGSEITLAFVQEALRDVLSLQDKLVSMDNILKTTAEYYKIKVADILSKRRNRSIARPRQVAMSLCKELTNHSLPEIGDAFGGRDHTTVLHACRTIAKLKETDKDISEDFGNLLRILST